MKIRKNKHIQLDDINCRWQRLCMGENGISVMDEWNGVQERPKKVSYKLKQHIEKVSAS